jgi:hypothetical protein
MFKDHGSKPQGFDLNHDLKWTVCQGGLKDNQQE